MAKSINSRLLVGILALILVCGLFVSVKAWNSKAAPTLTDQWFTYHGETQNRTDIENPQNYTLLDAEPACSGGAELCSVQAPAGAQGEAVLETALVNEIMDVIDTRVSTNTIKLRN